MQVIFCVFVFTCFGGAFAAPTQEWYDSSSSSSFSQSYDGYPFGYTGAFAGAGDGAVGLSSGSWPYPGYTAFSPFFSPYFPFVWPSFKPIIPWYNGDGVCKEEKIVDDPDDLQSWFPNDNSRESAKHKSKHCQGNENTYICSERLINEKGSQVKYTKLGCCAGLIRNPKGPGCIKKPSNDAATATGAPTTPVKSEYHNTDDRYSYVFSSSKKDPTRGSDVEKVPLQ